ncbi:LSM domain, eukaryotic/archaea-type [Dillenia turbinata]|uniref:LSM domain, eukaryotic/archaea-type n=1 Tax=Dillenia turbinata TaxID=194707 RepID=A0AAN8V9I6_9MAGN
MVSFYLNTHEFLSGFSSSSLYLSIAHLLSLNHPFLQLFFSYFKDLVGKEVTVELKNDLAIRGILHSVDQYLNIKLEHTRVVDQDKYPHMNFMISYVEGLTCKPHLLFTSGELSVRNCFIRGSVVRYVQLPPDGVDVDLLHDATRREARGG